MEVTAKERRQVEEQVERSSSGQGSEVNLCDVGSESSKPATSRKNVTYIVCGVVFNDQEEVSMVQEAKPDCYKQWYSPAGRVEVGESSEEASRREVKEEAGFDCQPITSSVVQEQGPQWIRFVFSARITGGSMKTSTEADQESSQASWWDRQSPSPLRGRDISRLIECGLRYHRNPWHPVASPSDSSCRHIVMRISSVFVGAQNRVWISSVRAPVPHLPTAAASRTHAVTWAANMVVQEAAPSSYYEHDVSTSGVLSSQHNGRQHGKTDGVCLNASAASAPDRPQRDEDGSEVAPPPATAPPPVENPRYVWMEVQEPASREKSSRETQNPSSFPIQSSY